jgi:hypothetical protein
VANENNLEILLYKLAHHFPALYDFYKEVGAGTISEPARAHLLKHAKELQALAQELVCLQEKSHHYEDRERRIVERFEWYNRFWKGEIEKLGGWLAEASQKEVRLQETINRMVEERKEKEQRERW